MSVCKLVVDIKKDLPTNFARTLFLEHTSDHSRSISVFTDGFKSDTGVAFGVVFPEFYRGGSIPVVASVYTVEFWLYKLFVLFLLIILRFTVLIVVLSLLLSLILFLVIPWSSPHLSGCTSL